MFMCFFVLFFFLFFTFVSPNVISALWIKPLRWSHAYWLCKTGPSEPLPEKRSKHFKNTTGYFVLFSIEATQSCTALLKKEQPKRNGCVHEAKSQKISINIWQTSVCIFIALGLLIYYRLLHSNSKQAKKTISRLNINSLHWLAPWNKVTVARVLIDSNFLSTTMWLDCGEYRLHG